MTFLTRKRAPNDHLLITFSSSTFSHYHLSCIYHGFDSCSISEMKDNVLAPETTLRSEIITQLIPQKLFRAMITRISRNPARNNSSEIVWHNDKMAIAQIFLWKHATRTVREQRATTKLRNRPENTSPRVISRNRLRQFRAIPRKIIPL